MPKREIISSISLIRNLSKRQNLKPNYQKLASLFLIFSILLQTIAGAFLFIPTQSAQADYNNHWYNTSWLYRKQITINHTNIPHTDTSNPNTYLSNFPVLVSTTIPTDKARSDHNDIVFANCDASACSVLSYEIESYDTANGNLTAWVKVPQLNDVNNTQDTSFYMYYGNSSHSTSDLENKSGVWDSDFKGVWHLGDTPTGHAIGDYKDSTINANNSTNATNEPTATTFGKIDGAQSFNGTNSRVEVGNNNSLNITGPMTMEAWVNLSVGTGQQGIIGSPNFNSAYGLFVRHASSDIGLSYVTSSGNRYSLTTGTLNYGSLSHVVGIWDGSNLKIYINGNSAGGTQSGPVAQTRDFGYAVIGYTGNVASPQYFNGSIDEVRISDTARSADWIKTEYNNQANPNNPNSFYNLGGEENYAQYSTPPTLAQVIPVPTPTNSTAPSYTFSSTKLGTITYGGVGCSSSTASAVAGNNTITFNTLPTGTHSDCTIKVTDTAGNQSASLSVTSFTIDTNVTWYNVFWSYRKQITIDHTKVPHTSSTTNLTDFPLLVSITNNNSLKLSPTGKVTKIDGSDIIFANQAGTQLLNYEIESYNKDSGSLTAWVKIPTLYDASSIQDTIIYMYYGNSNAVANTQTNINSVWDADFKAVYHLKETGMGIANDYKDSTVNFNNSTNVNNEPTAITTGQIGGAQSFDGTNYIKIDNDINIGTNSFTFDFWAKTSVNTSNQSALYAPVSGIPGWEGYFSVPMGSSARNSLFFITDNLYAYVNPYNNSSNSTDGNWHHFVGVCDRSRHIPPNVYLDGAVKNDMYSSYCDQLTDNLVFNGLYIGSRGTGAYFFNGSLDEVRISDNARSADWIKTEYNNQSNPGSFVSLGNEENTSPAVLSQITPIFTPTNNATPSYTFSSTKSGTIAYAGDCSSSTTLAVFGSNAITFNLLSAGTHTNCTIQVTDGLGHQSNALSINSFTVNTLVTTYIVPAITDNKILPKASISSSYIGDAISTQISNGENKAVSFVVNSNVNINALQAEASDLTGSGNTISNSALDIKTVKCWYQGGVGTIDYSVSGRYLTPELLLKDDSLVSVDGDSWTQFNVSNLSGKNYLKVNGSYIDISSDSPQNAGQIITSISDRPVQDASSLQPLNLPANYNKQFWITLHVPDDTPAGSYTGTISLKNGAQIIKSLNATIQVLPINLLQPNVEYSMYYTSRIDGDGSISSKYKTVDQYTAEQIDMQKHGVTNPNFYSFGTDSNLLQELSIRQQAGLDNTNFYHVVASGTTADANYINYYKNLTAPYGVVNWYEYGPDETSLNDTTHRANINSIHNAGGKYFVAQSISQADSVADVLDLAVVAGNLSSSLADKYHGYGHKVYSYANPQTVPEYPRTFRMNYGLALWQANYDGVMDFAYQYSMGDIWNDFDYNTYRDHVFAYPTANGVIDTVEWEGFKEGINDMRYLATLQNAIVAGDQNDTTIIEAKNYLANLKNSDLVNQDIDAIRSQMINYILALQSRSYFLTINNGTGSSFYVQGDRLSITANIPSGMVFNKWIGDTQYISNANTASATVTMPSHAISLTATYYSSLWYDGYSYRRMITINHTKVSDTEQSNFPILVSLTDASLKNVANGGKIQNLNGYDIIFTLPDKTLLSYEIESYDNTIGKLVAWIKIPSLSASNDAFCYIYYGKSDIINLQSSVHSVWDGDFKGVWHMKGTASGTVGDYTDSTINANDNSNTTNEPAYTSNGQIGGAQSFNGSSQYVDVGNQSSLNIGSAITLSAWVKAGSATPIADYYEFLGRRGAGAGNQIYEGFYIVPSSAGNYALRFGNQTDKNTVNIGSIDASKFVHIVATYNNRVYATYYNGALVSSGTASYDVSGINVADFFIGKSRFGSNYFNGSLDEVRISDIARSADWIKTEYNNQSFPSTFSTLSSEENLLPPTITSLSANLPSGTYSTGTTIPITINFSKDVTSTGNITLTLNTTPQRTCSFSITNNNSATCNYIIQGGDSATNLNATISGNIHDQFNNLLTNFTTTSNLSDNTTININTSSSPFTPPTKPNITNINITVLDNGTTTFDNLPSNINQIAISRTPDFANISWQPFDQDKLTYLNETQETLYLKFRTKEGAVSNTIIYTPKVTSLTTQTLNEGDIVKTPSSPDVYVIKYKNNKQYKRLILSPLVFKSYQHLKWENIKIVSQNQLDQYTTSNLVKETKDTIIYLLFPNGDTGERKALNTSIPYDPDSIYEINVTDRDMYKLEK